MKQYEYQKVRVRMRWGLVENEPEEDYFSVIQREAARGWRFVEAISPSNGVQGISRWIDLIFEREC